MAQNEVAVFSIATVLTDFRNNKTQILGTSPEPQPRKHPER